MITCYCCGTEMAAPVTGIPICQVCRGGTRVDAGQAAQVAPVCPPGMPITIDMVAKLNAESDPPVRIPGTGQYNVMGDDSSDRNAWLVERLRPTYVGLAGAPVVMQSLPRVADRYDWIFWCLCHSNWFGDVSVTGHEVDSWMNRFGVHSVPPEEVAFCLVAGVVRVAHSDVVSDPLTGGSLQLADGFKDPS